MNKLLGIDFLIQKDNRTIVLDIKHMDESLRKGNFSFLAQSEGGKYSIWSNYSPVMNGSKLLLRGDNKEQDNEFTYHTFNSTEEMHEYITNMHKLIDEINNPMVEIDLDSIDIIDNTVSHKGGDYTIKVENCISSNYIEIIIHKNEFFERGIKFWYISDDETTGQPFDEVSEEFDNFCKRRGIKAKLIKG